MLWCLTYNFNLSNRIESTDCELKINTFTKNISILLIDWPGLSRSPNSAISRVNFSSMFCIFSHSWTWDQKQATWGQYQNKWSIDSVSSQQNMQICDDCMTHIFNTLLVARIMYNNFSWKHEVLNFALFYISTYTPCTMEFVRQKYLSNYVAICMAQLSTSLSSN